MSHLPRRAAAVLTLLLLASCSSTDGRPQSSATSPATTDPAPSAAASTSTSAPVPAPPPKARACYRLGFQQLAALSNDSTPVSCRSTHNAQTIHVGRLRAAGGHAGAVGSDAVQRQLERACRAQLAPFVGGSAADRRLSRFAVVWFSPTAEQVDRGADWFRCDLVAFAGTQQLLDLPPTPRLRSVLDRPGALRVYGLCGTRAPGAEGFQRVACARRHSWRAVSTVDLADHATYPGGRAVRRAGDDVCRDRVHRARGFSLRFRYGWEWPTRQQWREGRRYGFCWAPD